MTGRIISRSDSSYTIVIENGRDPVTGKRNRITKAVKMNKKDAEKEMRRMMNELENGNYVEPSNMTVGQVLQKWYEVYCLTNLEKTTCENYKYILDAHLIPYFEKYPAQKLLPLHIQEYLAEKKKNEVDEQGKTIKKGLSNRSLRYHFTLLKAALRQAQIWKIISKNPADEVKPPKKIKPQINFLTPEQLQTVFEEAKKINEDYAAVFIGAGYTGMRRGEVLALKWDKVDIDKRIIYVEKSLAHTQEEGLKDKGTKTEKSVRSIPLAKKFVRFLKKHRKNQMKYMLLLGDEYKKNNLVFCKKNGEPLDPNYATHLFTDVAKKLGFNVTLHGLRHTFVSILIGMGVDLKTIQEIIGHEDPATTLGMYGHLLPGKKEEAIRSFEVALGGKGTQNGHKK